MTIDFTDDRAGVDWQELEALYRAAPRGNNFFDRNRFDARTFLGRAGWCAPQPPQPLTHLAFQTLALSRGLLFQPHAEPPALGVSGNRAANRRLCCLVMGVQAGSKAPARNSLP